jgi:ribokinase
MTMAEIVVIGSINMDLVVRTARMPVPGETLHGENLNMIPGGKGANQAAAVAKMGGDVAMIGRVGSDVFGQKLTAELNTAGVNTENILTQANCASGTALIIVDQKGQNSIVVSPGANGTLSPVDIQANERLIQQSKILILQFEIPSKPSVAQQDCNQMPGKGHSKPGSCQGCLQGASLAGGYPGPE